MNDFQSKGLIISSHQPNFLPYMGLFYKAAKSDIMVISDDVQFSKKGMHNWNRIYTTNGVKKITIPVSAHHDDRLADVIVSDPGYTIPKAAKTLRQEYRKASHYNEGTEIVELLEAMGSAPALPMADLNIALTKFVMKRFGIKTKLLRATSDLDISGHKDERMFRMCEQTGASEYFSGTGAKVYHDENEYARRGIRLVYSDYQPVVYKQMHEPFETNLSVIDYVMNCGFNLPTGWMRR